MQMFKMVNLDLLIIKNCSTTDLISLFKDYKLNSHEKSPFITYVQAKELTIECDKGYYIRC